MTLISVEGWRRSPLLRFTASCVILYFLGMESAAQEKTSLRADTIVMHARVYTVNERQPCVGGGGGDSWGQDFGRGFGLKKWTRTAVFLPR